MTKKSPMRASPMKSQVRTRSPRSMKGGKSTRPLNEYMKTLMQARRVDAPSFTYKGGTYVRRSNPHPRLAPVYYKE